MSKTYLQVINSIHARARGATVTDINTDADTTLIAAFINTAKEQVETEWKWHPLRKTITFTSVIGTASYDTSSAMIATVTQTNERSMLLWDAEQPDAGMFWDATVNGQFRMTVAGRDAVLAYIRTSNNQNATDAPGTVAVYPNGSGLTVLFADTPTAVRNYTFEVYSPQNELTAKDDIILAPWQPIRDLACAMAAEERGDMFGISAARFYDFYADSLAQAIAAQTDNQYDDAMVVV